MQIPQTKFERLKKIMEIISLDTMTPNDVQKFLMTVLQFITKSKTEFDQLSAENIKTIKDSIAYIENINAKAINSHNDITNQMVGQFDAKIALLKGMIDKVQLLKPLDGKDADEEMIIKTVLKKIPELDDRTKIVTKINSGKDKDLKIEAKQITGLPEFTREVVREVGSVGHIETPLKAGENITITKDASGASVISSPGDVTATWGSIAGTLSSQTDLQTALNGKISTYASQTAKYFLAAPNAGNGTPSFRAIVASDIPALAYDAAGAAAAVTPTTLGLVIGTNVQAYNANLTAINQALTTTSSPSFTAVTAALTGHASLDLALTGGTMTGGITNSTSVNPLTTLAESWIGPSSTAGVYFKGGNVGIGTTGPSYPLDVRGSVGIVNSGIDGTLADVLFFSAPAVPITYRHKIQSSISTTPSDNILSFLISDGSGTGYKNDLTLLGNGNVGIGTTTPLGKLQIGLSVAGGEPTVRGDLIVAGSNGLEFKIDASGAGHGSRIVPVFDGNSAYNLAFQNRTNSATWATQMTITSTGNVGIGTTGPATGLEILRTTEQLRLSYDATHFSSFTVNSAGDLTLVGGTTAKLTATTFVGALTGTASGNLTSASTLDATKLSGAIPSAVTATTQSANDNSTKLATTAYADLHLEKTGGTLTGGLNEAKGADIASATTTDIGAGTGNYVEVTGTTTITGLGTVQAGTRRIVKFTGVLLLTYNATSLILPSNANITTQAGDTSIFVSLGSGNWICTSYQRDDGSALVSSGGGTVVPKMIFSTDFEKAERFVISLDGSANIYFSSNGFYFNTGATSGSSGKIGWKVGSFNNTFMSGAIFKVNTTIVGTIGTRYLGLGDISLMMGSFDFNSDHVGFKIVSGNLYATQGDGGGMSETASSVITTVSYGDNLDLMVEIISSSSVNYYYRKNGATWSSPTNLTTNFPSGTSSYCSLAVTNDSANAVNLESAQASFEY